MAVESRLREPPFSRQAVGIRGRIAVVDPEAASAASAGPARVLAHAHGSETTLAALASHHIVVPESDRKGGDGANFIVEWRARSRVMRPLVQTLMLTDASLQGIAFLADAVVLEERAGLPAQ